MYPVWSSLCLFVSVLEFEPGASCRGKVHGHWSHPLPLVSKRRFHEVAQAICELTLSQAGLELVILLFMLQLAKHLRIQVCATRGKHPGFVSFSNAQITPYYSGKSGWERGGRHWSRSHGGVLLTGLLLMARSSYFLRQLRTTYLSRVGTTLSRRSLLTSTKKFNRKHFLNWESLFSNDSSLSVT